jgi:hypothetical protein
MYNSALIKKHERQTDDPKASQPKILPEGAPAAACTCSVTGCLLDGSLACFLQPAARPEQASHGTSHALLSVK